MDIVSMVATSLGISDLANNLVPTEDQLVDLVNAAMMKVIRTELDVNPLGLPELHSVSDADPVTDGEIEVSDCVKVLGVAVRDGSGSEVNADYYPLHEYHSRVAHERSDKPIYTELSNATAPAAANKVIVAVHYSEATDLNAKVHFVHLPGDYDSDGADSSWPPPARLEGDIFETALAYAMFSDHRQEGLGMMQIVRGGKK